MSLLCEHVLGLVGSLNSEERSKLFLYVHFSLQLNDVCMCFVFNLLDGCWLSRSCKQILMESA